MRAWLNKSIAGLACAYPAALLLLVLLFHFAGERWWVSAIGLFLPRLVWGLPLLVFVPLLAVKRRRRYLWTQAIALVLLVFPLMGFVLPTPTRSSGPSFTLLSFNVDSCAFGTETVFRAITEHNPDVVLLQEVTDSSKLDEQLKQHYPVVHSSTQFLLATRYPLVDVTDPERIPYGTRQRSPRFMRYVLATPAGKVAFYNVHPLSPRESFYILRGKGLKREIASGRLFEGVAAPDILANSGLRELQIEEFGGMASAEAGRVVVAGDTNQPWLAPLLTRTLPGFTDAFRHAGSGFGYTFPSKRPWMRLDRVFSRGLSAAKFEVGCRGASDHLCVFTKLAP